MCTLKMEVHPQKFCLKVRGLVQGTGNCSGCFEATLLYIAHEILISAARVNEAHVVYNLCKPFQLRAIYSPTSDNLITLMISLY